jgi:ATP-dependent RNA helicase DDX27
LQNKTVVQLFDKIVEDLDDIAKEIETEQQAEVEMGRAMMEAKRAENLIKYKDDIMNRPKKHWMVNQQQKKELKEKSKDDLKNVKARFDEQLQ